MPSSQMLPPLIPLWQMGGVTAELQHCWLITGTRFAYEKQTHPQDHIILKNEEGPLIPAKPPLRVNNEDVVWQNQMSEGNLYQAKRTHFVHFTKVHIQLVETWRTGWLGGLQFKDISGAYIKKESNIGFPTPEEALAAVQTFISLKEEGLRMLRSVHTEKELLQCKIGRYDQILSIGQSRLSSSKAD